MQSPNTSSQSEDNRQVWQNAAVELLERLRAEEEDYGSLTRDVRELCQRLFNPGTTFPTQISARTKTLGSLRKKVQQQAIKFSEEESKKYTKDEALDKLQQAITDYAGVRILVYFPGDVPKVVKAIEGSETLTIETTRFSSTQSRTVRDRSDMRPDDYPRGDWHSGSKGGIDQYWRNSGYRAVHIHVKFKDEAFKQLHHPRTRYTKTAFDRVRQKLTEIQITTIVMHVWSQVEHDIIYKKPPELLLTASMNRMIDGINGLSTTSEILLEQLARNLKDANEEVQNNNERSFQNEDEFKNWFKQTYPETGVMGERYDHWKKTPEWTRTLFFACEDSSRRAQATQKNSTSPFFFLHVISSRHNWIEDEELKRDKEYLRLARLTLVASAFSFMVAFKESEAIETLKNKFPRGVENMRQINAIISLFGTDVVDEERLEHFAIRFLKADWGGTYDLAVALAKLGFFITDKELGGFQDQYMSLMTSDLLTTRLGPFNSSQRSSVFGKVFQEQYGEVQPVVFDTGIFREHGPLWRGNSKDEFNKTHDLGPNPDTKASTVTRILQCETLCKDTAALTLVRKSSTSNGPLRFQTARYLSRKYRNDFIKFTTVDRRGKLDRSATNGNRELVSAAPIPIQGKKLVYRGRTKRAQ
ncbi:hypothetical protein F4806DRAFT_503907 [Annulohypoxylon nitens]|nr:hypothetical protein F4806DRAFT_503907 [Annulohypoxylon nitens]